MFSDLLYCAFLTHRRGAIGLSPPSETYTTYLWKTHQPCYGSLGSNLASVTLLESRTTIEGGTTGLRTWSASYVLAEYLLSHGELVRGKRVLEIGSGAGFLGLVIAAIQLQSGLESCAESFLWLTDVDSTVLKRCQGNARLLCNASSGHRNLQCQPLDWTDAMDPRGRPLLQHRFAEMAVDVVLGADIVCMRIGSWMYC